MGTPQLLNQFPSRRLICYDSGMNQPIIIISGSKGGVGKSLTTYGLAGLLSATNHKFPQAD